ncbi:M23 family metallopeptidase [Fodinibius halophilus]|uniref:Peptidoglycan DD-metalloendopeptidase family protein n=1 Tax=Fodinibius halophilus TaxID=1736908 RepID=A0A6M1T5C1_9BACT|nr:M23 family metallopeptidase [Fodinibius halophilus]NGP88455.1 peptidoglycan DD-metalloendopeptidase family protein [Fodinibius halophilus]
MAFVNLFVAQLLLPFLFIIWLWNSQENSRINWILLLLATSSVVGFSLIVGAQAWTSIYLGLLILVAYFVAVIKSLFRLPAHWGPIQLGNTWQKKVTTITYIIICLCFIPLNIFGLMGYTTSHPSIELQFPLQNGVYHVAHGGSTPLINYHNIHEAQQFALDISELNSLGTRAKGIYPNNLSSYAIYADTVYSPCSGRIQKAVSDLPDYIPPNHDPKHPAGNHVMIKCKEAHVYLAHLLQKSVLVDSSEIVSKGTPVGQVGNSGNTSEPHLHIHATRDGVGIPILFNGRFLVRNSLIW